MNIFIFRKTKALAYDTIKAMNSHKSVSNKKVVEDDGVSEKLAEIEALLSSNI